MIYGKREGGGVLFNVTQADGISSWRMRKVRCRKGSRREPWGSFLIIYYRVGLQLCLRIFDGGITIAEYRVA
jgi:hypothetical protein